MGDTIKEMRRLDTENAKLRSRYERLRALCHGLLPVDESAFYWPILELLDTIEAEGE